MKNKFLTHAHISETKFKLILKYFCEDLTTTQIASLTKISRRSISDISQKLRLRILTIFSVRQAVKSLSLGQLFIDIAGEILSGPKEEANYGEDFWLYTKNRLLKFNGIRQEKYSLHLVESKFRWKKTGEEIYKILIEDISSRPL